MMNLLQMSISACILIVFITIARVIMDRVVSRRIIVWLWGIAIARLLLPFSFPLPFGLAGLWDDIGSLAPVQVSGTALSAETIVQNLPTKGMAPASINPALLIWLVGLVTLLAYYAVSWLRNHNQLKDALPINDPFIDRWTERLKLHRHLEVYVSDRIATPITTGVLFPKVILPKHMVNCDEQQLLYILTHEMTHIRRFDVLWKLLSLLALCLHWFNPAVWILCALLNKDIEIACDENVLRLLGKQNKADYAMTLIQMVERNAKINMGYGFSKNAVKKRICKIMNYKNHSMVCAVLGSILLLCSTLAFSSCSNTYQSSYHSGYHEEASVISREELYAQYADFGMTYNADDDRLYYNGEKVHDFYDPVMDINYSVPDGAIYLEAFYKKNILSGISIVGSDTSEAITSIATDNKRDTTANSLYSWYEQYGLVWNDTDNRLYYNDEKVRYFFDDRTFLGMAFGSNVEYTYDDGTVGIRATRDTFGQLTGLCVMTQEEFDDTTELLEQEIKQLG
jgi:beta-lactamase regulating signal transducer with metallopeptidase domain